jgi:hypothetical protein
LDQSDQNKFLYKDLAKEIISCAIEVHSHLGPGSLQFARSQSQAWAFDQFQCG